MRIFRAVRAMRRWSEERRRRGNTVGFVPTMGSLHAGHLSLLRRARRECGSVVVSIFVNPLQFGPQEDFRRYPRPLSRDKRLCAGADALFLPSPREMYPEGFRTHAEVDGLSDILCGESRPGHFRGVATAVLKLFEAVRPHRAYFGEKDYQQLVLLARMARDLDLGVEVVPCPIVREPDGLALSSRNAYLSPRERARASRIHAALAGGVALARARPGAPAVPVARRVLADLRRIPGARVDYVRLVEAGTLETARRLRGRLRLLAAVRIGRTRLIDNLPLLMPR